MNVLAYIFLTGSNIYTVAGPQVSCRQVIDACCWWLRRSRLLTPCRPFTVAIWVRKGDLCYSVSILCHQVLWSPVTDFASPPLLLMSSSMPTVHHTHSTSGPSSISFSLDMLSISSSPRERRLSSTAFRGDSLFCSY